MSSSENEAHRETVIVYGRTSNPAAILRKAMEDHTGAPLTPYYARVSQARPNLRLSSRGWLTIPLNLLPELSTTEAMRENCRQKVIINASQFAKLTRQFLDVYMNFALDMAQQRDSGVDAELFVPEDWFYSAWLPLPEARIPLPADDNEEAEFAEVDVAFWVDGRLIAVTIEGSSTRRKSAQERLDRLIDSHPAMTYVPVPRESFVDGTFPQDLLPDYFADYTRGLALPHGLSPPEELIRPFAG